jgi:NAD(P)-dependent dehydrogenase (short-subunit alcohol dehydrogenase family)
MTNNEMQGKVCLITGANGSIGKYSALGLAQRGATVVMVYCSGKQVMQPY